MKYVLLTILLATIGGAEPYAWVSLLLVPVTSAITWFVTWKTTKNKRQNDAISNLQSTVNMLLEENAKLYKETLENRAEIVKVRQENAGLKAQLEQVLNENKELKGSLDILKRKFIK